MFHTAWKRWKRFLVGSSLALGVSLGGTSGVFAQAPVPGSDPATIQELQRRLDALEKQNQQLMDFIQQKQQPVITNARPDGEAGSGAVAPADPNKEATEKIIKDYLKKEADDKKKKEDEDKKKKEDEGYVVGAATSFTFKWDGNQLWGETEDKAFRIHVGGRTQFDTIFYQAGDGVQFGNNGTGRVDDGVAFRRGRFAMEGTMWEVIDFNCEYDFVNTDTLQQNTATTTNAAGVVTAVTPARRVANVPVPTDLWVGFRSNPAFGTLRIGNLKPPTSFEHLTSSRFLNFIERSYGFDMYVGGPDNGFTPGVLYMNNFADDRIHVAASFTRFNQTIYGFNTGDGEWATSLRGGIFPIWEHDGRCAMWLGMSYRHVDPDFIPQSGRNFSRETLGQYRIRARTELRNGPAELHTPLIDIFPFAESADLLNPEFAAVWGPWTFQGEYFANWLNGARATATGPSVGTHFSQSAYFEALYFLTGEHRAFNRKLPSFGRVVPHENFWALREECNNWSIGRGAWQVGARYSWADNSDKGLLGGNNIIGNCQSVTLGLNWFLNPNMKLQWNYTYEMRYNINTVAGANAGLFPAQSSDGSLQGFGMRMAIDW